MQKEQKRESHFKEYIIKMNIVEDNGQLNRKYKADTLMEIDVESLGNREYKRDTILWNSGIK